MKAHIYTFGLSTQVRPPEAVDVTVDCRIIDNPFGRVAPDATEAALAASPALPKVLGGALTGTLEVLRHREAVSVGVFCNYGRHRSPYVATKLAALLAAMGVQTTIADCNRGA